MSILDFYPLSIELLGPIPAFTTLLAISILLGRIISQLIGRHLLPLSGLKAFCLSQGLVGLIAMATALSLFEIRPNFSVKEWVTFIAVFTSLGAAMTLLTSVMLKNGNFWPNLFCGVEKKALLRTRTRNISTSLGILTIFYGGLALIYYAGPENFVTEPFYKTKSRLFILLFGSPESVITWSWVAAAFLGVLVAALAYLLMFEIFWRRNMEH